MRQEVQQSKRLFPWVVVGSILAIIVSGLVNDALVAALGIPNLLLVGVGALGEMARSIIYVLSQRLRALIKDLN